MKRNVIRSTLFNLCFYCATLLGCLACLPGFILPRKSFMGIVHGYLHVVHFLEVVVLGLRYRVEGAEHLPQEGSYILAAKHQSAYETLKLHLLFKDPAIILKKELLSIPLWGTYLGKSGPIAIDRSSPDSAISSINEGAERTKHEGRPIVIFPQGTRVLPEHTPKNKPYKLGVVRIQEATDLPIIPMALNAGLFWPRTGWLKSSGVVTFKFLPPIEPGQDRQKVMDMLEKQLEEESNALMEKARADNAKKTGSLLIILTACLPLIFAAYGALWYSISQSVKDAYVEQLSGIEENKSQINTPEISGFPGPIHLSSRVQEFSNSKTHVIINDFSAKVWPLPFLPIHVTSGEIELRYFRWENPLHFEGFEAELETDGRTLNILSSHLWQERFAAQIMGNLDLTQDPIPRPDLLLRLENHSALLALLSLEGVIDGRAALFAGAAFSSLQGEDGIVEISIAQKDDRIYAGPIPLMRIPSPPSP